MFEFLHQDALAGEADAFAFEAETLFVSGLARSGDASAGPDDAKPGKVMSAVERANGEAGSARDAGGFGDGSIGRDLAFRDLADLGANRLNWSELRHG